MNTQNDRFKLEFMPIGQDIKRGREAKDVTREQLSEKTGYAPRHIQAIENEGQTPSVDLLFQLAEMFDVSLDRHIFKDRDTIKVPYGGVWIRCWMGCPTKTLLSLKRL